MIRIYRKSRKTTHKSVLLTEGITPSDKPISPNEVEAGVKLFPAMRI